MNIEPSKKVLQEVIDKYNEGNLKQSLDEIKVLIKNYPNSALSYNIQGTIEMTLDNIDVAEKSFRKAILLKDNYFHAINNLGLIYYKKESYEQAIHCFKKASKFDKDYNDPYLNLSAVYIDTNNFEKAKSILKKVISLNTNLHQAYYNLSRTNIKLGNLNLAIENLKKAISIDRMQLNYLKDLGNIYLQKGENEIGLNYLKEYLKIFPNSTEVYFYISLLKKYHKNDELFQPIFDIDENKLSENKKTHLFFTYGKIFGDLKNFEKSFFYYEKANSIKNTLHPFDIENEIKLLPILKKHFENKNFHNKYFSEKKIDNTAIPIFIVGMPRSGTSLIDQILSKHLNIKALGELECLGDSINKLDLINSEFTKEKGKLLNKSYIKSLNKKDIKQTYFTDKTPTNYRWIGYIFGSFSKAKIIHIQRNPQAVCWSNFKSNFSGKANDFSNNLENIVKYYLNYENIMKFYNKIYKGKIYNITYEDLVNNFDRNVEKLISYLNLEWDKNCLRFYESNRYVSTASFSQVKKKIFFNSSDEWKKYKKFLNKYFKELE